MKKETLKVTGMHCKSCAMLIEETLSDNGVKVYFNKDQATVEYDEKKISSEKIKKLIKDDGYGVE